MKFKISIKGTEHGWEKVSNLIQCYESFDAISLYGKPMGDIDSVQLIIPASTFSAGFAKKVNYEAALSLAPSRTISADEFTRTEFKLIRETHFNGLSTFIIDNTTMFSILFRKWAQTGALESGLKLGILNVLPYSPVRTFKSAFCYIDETGQYVDILN